MADPISQYDSERLNTLILPLYNSPELRSGSVDIDGIHHQWVFSANGTRVRITYKRGSDEWVNDALLRDVPHVAFLEFLGKIATTGRISETAPIDSSHNDADESPTYRLGSDGLHWQRYKKTYDKEAKEWVWEPYDTKLCNFDARISKEILRDDGSNVERFYVLDGVILSDLDRGHVLPTIEVSTDDFAAMKWAYSWAVGAVVGAGSNIRDNLRAAVQELSADHYTRRTVYTHTGWRKLGGKWVYLHAGGVITEDGLNTNIEVDLGDKLSCYRLPEPSKGEQLREDSLKLLRLLDGISDTVGFLNLGYTVRPVLNQLKHMETTDFVHGTHAIFKTAMCAVYQAFYGADFRADTLPLGWESTPNAVEMILHCTKDVLNTLDDFKPAQSKGEQTKLYTMADRVIRGNANQQERLRLRQDAKQGRSYSYRAGLRSSGEIPPIGQSLKGRMCLRKVTRGDIPKAWLDKAQKDAAAGVYARVMAAFIKWLAPKLDTLDLYRIEGYWRDELALQLSKDAYARTASNLAECYSGFALFIAFMVQSGVLTPSRAQELRKRCRIALVDIGNAQENYIKQEEPTDQFIEMLKGALGGGFGWLKYSDGDRSAYGAGGICIGYHDADTGKVWLIGRLAYKAAFEFAKRSGVDLGKEGDLWAALADKEIISKETGDTRRYSVLRRIDDKQRRVREMDASTLIGEDV